MNKLISLELKRNGFCSYHMAVLISACITLAFLYLLAALPKLDPTETDLGMFLTYESLINLTNIILMVIFTVLSAIMSSKFIVEEYSGKRAILLFCYPVERQKILNAKISMVFLYTVAAMAACGTAVMGIFFITESVFPLCGDSLSGMLILKSIVLLVCYSLTAGAWGIVALWFGFGRQSVAVTIIAAVIIAVFLCQFMAMFMAAGPFTGAVIFMALGLPGAAIAAAGLKDKVRRMEI